MSLSLPVYIASGGASRRFGSDKARAVLPDGRTLLEHVVEPLRDVASTLTVVADRADKYTDLGLRTIADLQPGRGPLAGLQTALHDAGDSTWIFYTSCDFPSFDLHWIQQLWNARMPDSSAVAFQRQPTGAAEFPGWEPVFALYHTRLLPAVTTALQENKLTFWRFLDAVSAQSVTPPVGWENTISINAPADLQTYLHIMKLSGR